MAVFFIICHFFFTYTFICHASIPQVPLALASCRIDDGALLAFGDEDDESKGGPMSQFSSDSEDDETSNRSLSAC